jgi:hypothetical protein
MALYFISDWLSVGVSFGMVRGMIRTGHEEDQGGRGGEEMMGRRKRRGNLP